ncbi:restriction endonuclease [Aromatoleum toluclasticum]|uniref:restriction endonuclease n=1 Tax=Aromatoleum toluclasticum TaxID=92003 RepID=UPI001D194BB2|nr:restriction endonuclease [Aromatoleum toluclasticum]MCC4118284.1 restriction endonuclease [Aromatoleum toluclasticum]
MSRRHRKHRKDPGLLEIAATSDWKVSAVMAAVSALAAAVLIPVGFGRIPILAMIPALLSPLAWLMACVFAVISLVRFFKQKESTSKGSTRTIVARKIEPRESTTTEIEISDLDREMMASVFSPATLSDAAPDGWSLELIHRVEWKRFEDLCREFYREKGVRAETTKLGADGGVDIRLYQDDTNPSRCTAIVQCKAWSQATGIKAIRELRGVMAHENIEKAFFMAPSGFTDEARAFAVQNRITLIDGKLFLSMLQRLPEEGQTRLLQFATVGDWTTPTCPGCGEKMTARDSSRGRFWGCITYPRCRTTLPMRATSS